MLIHDTVVVKVDTCELTHLEVYKAVTGRLDASQTSITIS